MPRRRIDGGATQLLSRNANVVIAFVECHSGYIMIEPPHSIESLQARAASELNQWTGSAARWSAAAPGRVNIIGEHTDYNGGWVLPMAIDRYTVLVAAPGLQADRIRVRSLSLGEQSAVSLSRLSDLSDDKWMRYLQGVLAQYAHRAVVCPPLDIVVASSVPVGGGLSSSAALELAMAHLIEAVTETTWSPSERIRAAVSAERDGAGVPCGIMDQTIVEQGEQGCVLLLDCAEDLISSIIPCDDPQIAWLVIHSGVSHDLADGAYAQRRAECEMICEALQVGSLRDVTPETITTLTPDLPAPSPIQPSTLSPIQSRLKVPLDEVLLRRARHVVTENQRVLAATEALKTANWSTLGELLFESHHSLRDDYQVSCEELDVLVELAQAQDDVFGARMTGGGFGGCIVALVNKEALSSVATSISQGYAQRVGLSPQCYRVKPASGADVCAVFA
ncbi:galactokinase [Luminiphilus sp.]|nr:galactokinase [Luminiphilus sp.]